MPVAQRYNKVLVHHSFGLPKLAKYSLQFPSSGSGIDPERTMPSKLFDALESTGQLPRTIAIVTSKFPGTHYISAGAREVAAARGMKVVLYLEYEFGNREFGPIAARIKEVNPDLLWVGAIGLDGNLLLDAFQTIGYKARGQYYQFPAPGPLLTAPGAAFALAYTSFEAHPPMTSAPGVEELTRLFEERARQAGAPYPIAENHAGISFAAWQVIEAAVNGATSLDDKAIAGWLKGNKVDTILGRLSFDGENNYGIEHNKIRQIQNGRWVVVWPKEWAAPGARIVYPAP
jgi:ABC-type branched-subunit amino acid transport system substrate-binding protein